MMVAEVAKARGPDTVPVKCTSTGSWVTASTCATAPISKHSLAPVMDEVDVVDVSVARALGPTRPVPC